MVLLSLAYASRSMVRIPQTSLGERFRRLISGVIVLEHRVNVAIHPMTAHSASTCSPVLGPRVSRLPNAEIVVCRNGFWRQCCWVNGSFIQRANPVVRCGT